MFSSSEMHLPIIWIKRIPLLRGYFSHFISEQGTIFKDICFKQRTQFCSACTFIGLIYNGPANWSSRRQIPLFFRYFIIVIYNEVFVFFPESIFPKKNYFFFAFWHKKIRRQSVKGVLKALVKICKKIYGSKSPFTPKFQPWKITFDRMIC